ncbi:hypothetical protein Tco_1355242 [Tanacetum coccineum]
MYPRFIQLCLDMQRHKLQQHSRFYSVPSLTMKVFSNMKRSTKGFSGQEVPLFSSMLDAVESSPSPSRTTSSPSPTPTSSTLHLNHLLLNQHLLIPHLHTFHHKLWRTEEYHPPTPHDSPLHAVHSHGSDEGVLKIDEGVHKKQAQKLNFSYRKVTPTEVIHEQEELLLTPRRSAEKRKDKGKGIMTDEEPKKKSKKELEQERLSYAEALRLEEQMNEEQRAQIARDAEIARQWEEEEKKKAMDEAETTKEIDWNDPSVLRYHSLKMKPKSIAQARRNMIKYLKNQGNFKINDFKGIKAGTTRGKEKAVNEPSAKRKRSQFLEKQQGRDKTGVDTEKEERRHFLGIGRQLLTRKDVEELSVSKERYSNKAPEGYDLMLWGDLHTLFEPDKDDEIWRDETMSTPY